MYPRLSPFTTLFKLYPPSWLQKSLPVSCPQLHSYRSLSLIKYFHPLRFFYSSQAYKWNGAETKAQLRVLNFLSTKASVPDLVLFIMFATDVSTTPPYSNLEVPFQDTPNSHVQQLTLVQYRSTRVLFDGSTTPLSLMMWIHSGSGVQFPHRSSLHSPRSDISNLSDGCCVHSNIT